MALAPLPVTRLSDAVENSICEYIRENNLKTGDALPKEIELAEKLGVSRNIVREALSRLRMLGLVESRKRRGMVVAEPDVLSGLERLIGVASLTERTSSDLFELRLIIEIGLADLIFLRKTPDSIKTLEKLVNEEAALPQGSPRRVECDMQFHGLLYKLSGNRVLERFQSILCPYFRMAESRIPAPRIQKGRVTHADLIRILKNGSPEQFRNAMREHLADMFNSVSASK